MKSVRIHAFGNSQQLQVEDTPRPRAEAGQVLVAIRSAGVNPVDWKIREGMLAQRQPTHFPLTVGQDFAGEVMAGSAGEAGPGGEGFNPGDRVFGFAQGAYAEYAAVRVSDIAPLPDAISFETGAALPTPGLTAFQLVSEAVDLQPGQSVLVHGAAGAVGAIVVQLAVHRGARVFASDRGADLGYLQQLGAESVFATARPDGTGDPADGWLQPILKDPGKLDAVIDLVGGDLQRRSYELIRPGGVLASTVGLEPQGDEEARRRGIRAVAFVMRRNANDLEELARLVEAGIVRTRIARVLSLPDAKQAQELSQAGQARGKIILRVA